MSRSFKKPYLTDTSKKSKKVSHQKFRKKVKQKIQEQRFDEIPNYEREVENQYNVCDWRFGWQESDEDFWKSMGRTDEEVEKMKREYYTK